MSMRNPLLYMNRKTNERIVSYKVGHEVIWTHTINDEPQEPYRKATLTEFEIMVENGYRV
jgi:hypothetical protein